MGCHMWLYKKAKSLTLDEQIQQVKNIYSRCIRTFVQGVSREEFIADEIDHWSAQLNKLQELIDKGILEKDDYNYQLAKEFSDPEYIGNWYDESIEINEKRKNAYDAYIKNPNISIDEYIELHNILGNKNTANLTLYKGDWYFNIIFDTYFRCFEYSDAEIDNYDEMINYLSKVNANMIHQYGTFDKGGEFHYYNDTTYEHKTGLTEELKDMLKYLYKDNNIYIQFG